MNPAMATAAVTDPTARTTLSPNPALIDRHLIVI